MTFGRDGVALAVREAGAGRPMLWQHGLGGDAGQAAECFPASIGWRGVTVECRGHGGSAIGPHGALTLATLADDLAAFAEARLGPPLPVGGISMGAALALRLAVARPDLVSALVLARPAWATDAAPANLAPYRLVGDLLSRLSPDEARAAFEASDDVHRLAAEAPDNLATLRGFLGREPAADTAALLARLAADGPGVTASDLSAIRVPTLVIGHGRDLAHPWALAEALAAAIPDARLARVPPKADGRGPYLDAMRAALAAFLTELP